MARIRTIKPDFFRHLELYKAERETGFPLRVAFAGLWTACDREGRFVWSPEVLKLDCLPFDEIDFSRVLDALWTRGFLVKYACLSREKEGRITYYGFIPGFTRHQVVNNRETKSCLPEPNENNILTREPRVTDANGTPLGLALVEGKGREGEGKRESSKSESPPPTGGQAKKSPDTPTGAVVGYEKIDFEAFKETYPKRAGANPWEPARQNFVRAVRSGTPVEVIIAAAARYSEEMRGLGKLGTQYVAQAKVWLIEERWKDYPDLANGKDHSMAGRFYKKRGSKQFEAWDAYRRRTENKTYPTDMNGGWYFPSEWPPDHPNFQTPVDQQTSHVAK